jgi:nucleoid-associated protein YgaU
MGNEQLREQLKNFFKALRRSQASFKIILLGVLFFVALAAISYTAWERRGHDLSQVKNDVKLSDDDLRKQDQGKISTESAQVTIKKPESRTDIKPPVTQSGRPAAKPSATPTVKPALQNGKYVVQKGDTLFKIAQKLYGNGNKYSLIKTANKIAGEKILAGQVLVIPSDTTTKKKTVVMSTKISAEDQQYIVKKGDSLWKISAKKYSTGKSWPVIYRRNIKKIGPNPNRIYPKTKLAIPAKKVTVASRKPVHFFRK